MSETSGAVRFLYGTVPGRMLLKAIMKSHLLIARESDTPHGAKLKGYSRDKSMGDCDTVF